jgi:ribosomal protein S18 acetylase RimI-like enzyme
MSQSEGKDFVIRLGEVSDLPLLYLMLYEAAAVNPAIRQLDREAALSLPQVRKYVEGWGRPGDQAVVAAEPTGRQLGAAWYRLFTAKDPGYGFVSEDVPEVTIGVVDDARGRGIGSALLKRIVELARDERHQALSLSVESDNEAVALYKRHGFELVGKSKDRGSSDTMLLQL